jgi:hypothetical protein
MTYLWQIFNTNLNEIIQFFFKILNFFLENISKIFPKKQSPKGAPMAHISPFAPNGFFLYCYIVNK